MYFEKAKKAFDDLEDKNKIDVVGETIDELPDRILVVDSKTGDKVEECYNFKKLASVGVCRTESQEYGEAWGFCSTSCNVNIKLRAADDIRKGIKNGIMAVDELFAKYYDRTDYNHAIGLTLLPNDEKSGKKTNMRDAAEPI